MTALVVITGASRGIGAALARAVPWTDAHTVDVSRSGGTDADEHLAADLSDPGEWDRVATALERRLDRLQPADTALLHAAGTLTPIGFAGEVDAAAYRDAVLVNSAAGQVLGGAFLRATRGVPGRRVLTMLSSGAATSAYEGWSAYGAGKAALDQWVRTVGAEQARRAGATVCAIAPGVVATAMQEQIRRSDPADFPAVDRFVELHERGALADPDHVAVRLWEVLERGVEPGAVLDLRDLA